MKLEKQQRWGWGIKGGGEALRVGVLSAIFEDLKKEKKNRERSQNKNTAAKGRETTLIRRWGVETTLDQTKPKGPGTFPRGISDTNLKQNKTQRLESVFFNLM